MKKISVLTSDRFLFQKIKLMLIGKAEVTESEHGEIRIVDIDSGFAPKNGDVTIGRNGEAMLKIPFPLDALDGFINNDGPKLSLGNRERCAVLSGESIKLTEVEYALFVALFKRNGEFVSREDILNEVWGKDADPGIINVYVHYLREKLEKNGEKIILSSRKMGYKIDERYLGGDKKCSE